jgi:3-hydroxyacyl-[acyl-carrier-protein] dehydratase
VLEFSFVVASDHPSLPGHFPGQPVVPGVVVLDEVAARAISAYGVACRIARIPQVKFVAPLLPEQEAVIELDLDRDSGRARFRVLRASQPIASGELVLAPA